jgi:hypothetical protein
MVNHKNENLEEKFKHLFEIISNDTFLNKQAIGGEVPFFISTYNPANQIKVEKYIDSLKKKLEVNGIAVLCINLYDLSLEILKERNIFNKLLEKESEMPKDKFLRQLQSALDVETKIIPIIEKLLVSFDCKVLFITGIGLVYPYLRSHNILNNLQRVVKTVPTLMFFPGEYDGSTLNLFGKLKDDNYYRAFNIDIIKLKKEL